MNVQDIAAQAVRYCNAIDAYEAYEASIRNLAFATLLGKLKVIADGDREYFELTSRQSKTGLIATLVEFHCGGAVQEAEEELKKMGVNVEQLEEVRRAGKPC